MPGGLQPNPDDQVVIPPFNGGGESDLVCWSLAFESVI